MFQLTFLGTSSGMPTKYRNVSGLAVECVNPYLSGDKIKSKRNRPWILIDCGEGTQHQLLQTKLSVHQLSAICITHVHGDHCYGLPGLLSSMAMMGRKAPLKLIAPKPIGKLLDTLTITTQLYFPFAIEFIAIEDLLNSEHNQDKDKDKDEDKEKGRVVIDFSSTHSVKIEITELSHRVESYAFCLTQAINHLLLDTQKLNKQGIEPSPVWGQLKHGIDVTLDTGEVLKSADFVHTQTQVTKIVLSGDNDTPEMLTEAVQGASLLVHECTYTQAVADKIYARPEGVNPQHTTAKQVASFADKTNLPNLILTHFSARYQLFDDVRQKLDNMGHIREEIEQYCPDYKDKIGQRFWLANDFDVFEVRQSGVKKVQSVFEAQ